VAQLFKGRRDEGSQFTLVLVVLAARAMPVLMMRGFRAFLSMYLNVMWWLFGGRIRQQGKKRVYDLAHNVMQETWIYEMPRTHKA
jgi:hypothetical protein